MRNKLTTENKFAQRLYDLRSEKRLTQQKLAVDIGVSQKAIDFWEKGTNEPKATYVVKLAIYFGVTSDYLLGLEE